MFNEEKYKDTTKKLEVKFVRMEDDLLTPWQISDFISQLAKHYYKNELMNTISLALKHGISPKNIMIFNESFDINNSYSTIGILDFTKSADVRTFYHLLDPISMFPHEEIIKIKFTFAYFRSINEILYKYQFSRLDKNRLLDYYKKIKSNFSFKEVIKEIEDFTFEVVKESANDNKELFRKESKELTQSMLSNYSDYENNQKSLDSLIDNIEKNEFITFENTKKQGFEQKYFNEFFIKFESLRRPIIGIYYPENEKVQILCDSFINKTKLDPSKFLDLKSISHNSPYEAIFHIGMTIVVPLMSILSVALNSRKLIDESETSIEEREEAERRLERTIQQLEPTKQIEEVKAVEDIPQQYIKNKLKESYKQNNEKFQEPVEKYGFTNHKIEVDIFETSTK